MGPVALLQSGFTICKYEPGRAHGILLPGDTSRYACFSTDARVRWVPAHCVQPVLDGTPQSNGPGRSLPDSMEQQECLGGPVVHTEPNRILVAASLFFALATDVDSICHPTLQNCVDIDFCC